MKMIMAALAAAALLAGAAVPASAERDVEQIAEEFAKRADTEVVKIVKERRQVPRQVENDEPTVGSSAWWQKVDREQGGRRR